jgi:hypothetical protein
MFNSITHPYDLREIAMSGGGGGLYQVKQQQRPHIREIGHSSYDKRMGCYVSVHKLPTDFSDHNPLILATLCHQRNKVNELKFELSWLRQPDLYKKSKIFGRLLLEITYP